MTTRAAVIVAAAIIIGSLIVKFVPSHLPQNQPGGLAVAETAPPRYQFIKSEYGWVLVLDTTTGQVWSQYFRESGEMPTTPGFFGPKSTPTKSAAKVP